MNEMFNSCMCSNLVLHSVNMLLHLHRTVLDGSSTLGSHSAKCTKARAITSPSTVVCRYSAVHTVDPHCCRMLDQGVKLEQAVATLCYLCNLVMG